MQPMNGAKLDFPCEQPFLRVAHELHLRIARSISMAEKLQLLKLLQEIRGFAEVGNRADELRHLAHFSVNLRAAGQPTSLPIRRFLIPVRHEQHGDRGGQKQQYARPPGGRPQGNSRPTGTGARSIGQDGAADLLAG